MNRSIALTIITLMFILVASASMASTIFDNFGAGFDYHPDYYSSIGYDPSQFPFGDEYDLDAAMAFTVAGGNYELTTISVPLSIRGGDNEFDIRIMTDGGGFPGTTLEFWHVSGQVPSYPGVYGPITVFSSIKPVLTVGTTYWVFISATGPTDTSLDWHLNTVGYTGTGAQRTMINGAAATWNVTESYSTTMQVTGRLEVVSNESKTLSEVKALFR